MQVRRIAKTFTYISKSVSRPRFRNQNPMGPSQYFFTLVCHLMCPSGRRGRHPAWVPRRECPALQTSCCATMIGTTEAQRCLHHLHRRMIPSNINQINPPDRQHVSMLCAFINAFLQSVEMIEASRHDKTTGAGAPVAYVVMFVFDLVRRSALTAKG